MSRKGQARTFVTSVEIDEQLFARVCRCLPPRTTKKRLIDEALRTFLRLHEQAGIKSLRGKLVWDGNLEDLREERGADPR